MNLTIKKNILNKYLNFCNEVISENQSNPKLSLLLIKVESNKIEFICSNLYMKTKFTLKNDFILNGEEFNFMIKFKQLNSFISKMDSEYIEISKTLNKNITIKDDKLQCDLNIYDEDDYIDNSFKTISKIDNVIELEMKLLKNIKEKVVPNSSINIEQIKPINGINFEINHGSLIVVATDTYKVSRFETNINNSDIQDEFNVYSKTFEKTFQLLSSIHNEEDLIPIVKKNENLLIHTNVMNLEIKLITGNFPKTSKLFELEQNLSIGVDKIELYNAIERAKSILLTERTPVIDFKVSGNKLLIESNSPESGYFSEEININNFDNKKVSFKLNGLYFSSIIKLFKNKNLKIRIISNDKPIIIEDVDDESFKQIILPIRG